jgi:hypothetical protein
MASSDPVMPWRAVVFPFRSTSFMKTAEISRRKPATIWGSPRPWEFTPYPERFPTRNRSIECSELPMVRRKSLRNFGSSSSSLTTFQTVRKNHTITGNTPRLTETNVLSLEEKTEYSEPDQVNLSLSSSPSSLSSELTSSSHSSSRSSSHENKSPSAAHHRKKPKHVLTPDELRRKKLIIKARQVLLLTDEGFRTTKSH